MGGSLGGIFGSATRSLLTYGEALAVIQNNIANAATPGFARQRPVISPLLAPNGGQSFGVAVSAVQSLRDRLLDFQVFQARQSKAYFEQKTETLQQTELHFRISGEGSIGASIDRLFSSFSELSVLPSDLTLRRGVLSAADGSAAAMRTTYGELEQRRFDLDGEARTTVQQINSLLDRIASLAASPGTVDPSRPNASIETQLHQALDELATLTDFSLVRQSDGALAVIGGDGVALVVGASVHRLSVSATRQRLAIVDHSGRDVSAAFSAERGQLGALLSLRNNTLPGLGSDLNRLAKTVATQVNEQLARGVDLTGSPGQALFSFEDSSVTGGGRSAGTAGAATPVPPDQITVGITGPATAALSVELSSFFVAATPPTAAVAGDTVEVTLASADGSIRRTLTTAPLLGGETTSDLATRLNDQVALSSELAGLVTFSDAGNGRLKVVLSDTAGQGFSFTAGTNRTGFVTGLETGGPLGGGSAMEIAATLNAELAAQAQGNPALAATGIRFSVRGGQVTLDGDGAFDFTVTETPGLTVDAFGGPIDTGFASGLPASGSAGGSLAAYSLAVSNITPAKLATAIATSPAGNENALALAALGASPAIDGISFGSFYSLVVNRLGDESRSAALQTETRDQVLISAQNLRDSLSGVDINEEAVHLLEFEQAYQAMLRVIQVIDGLTTEVLNLVR